MPPGSELQSGPRLDPSNFLTTTLGSFGIRAGHDMHHGTIADVRDFPADRFFGEAAELLTDAAPMVLDDIVPRLEEIPALWNPGSFMVFPLGKREDGSSLRLHVWMRGLERQTPQGPNIHEHVWHLISRNLVAHSEAAEPRPYRDTLYGWEKVSPKGEADDIDLRRLYMTKRRPGGLDTLETDGTTVRPIPLLEREVQIDGIHTMESDTAHLSDIPPDQLTVTLVLDSPAFANSTAVLLDRSKPNVIERIRRPVAVADVLTAKGQILSHL